MSAPEPADVAGVGGPLSVGRGLIGDAVAQHVAATPDASAVVEVGAGGDRSWSWRELQDATTAAAGGLAQLGVQPGEIVGYQLPNRLEFVALSLAIIELGATCMPLMPVFRERELEFMLAQSAARILYVPETFRGHNHLAMAEGLADTLPALEYIVVPGRGSSLGLSPQASPSATGFTRAASAERAAQLLFTSGTSGEPKGVLHRHDVLMRAARRHVEHFGLTADDVIFSPAPLAHQTGFLYGMWLALSVGATLVAQEVWEGDRGFDAIQRHGVSFVQVSTPFLADVTRVAEERGERPRALRTFVATGAAIPRDLARRARDVLGTDVGGGFGTTESCMGAAFTPGEDPDRASQTDGRAMAGLTLRVVDDQGVELGPGEEGHFEIGSDTLFVGYLNRPDLTAEALTADGFYRTGDLARIDPDGYLRITGRTKDVINRGGEKVPVAEVEQLLYELEGVREVAIVAMPDPRLTERACAFVVVEPGHELGLDQVRAHLDARRLAKPYWPERVELVDELPKTPSGKIKKFVLREQAAALVHDKVGI